MPTTNIRSTTQEHLSIEDVTHNLILLKDGSVAMVLKVSAINFNLLSEQEQDSIIYSYAGLLNSLSFPIQILIRSQKKDISNYIRLLQSQESRELNPTIKSRITAYRNFIEKIVKERNVLDKSFFVIIPFSPEELGVSKNFSLSGKKPQKLPYEKGYILQKAISSLEPKRDHLLRQFAHLNLSPKQLATQELIQLFYNVYNPDAHEGVTLATPQQYQQSIVQSSTPGKPPTPSNQPTPIPQAQQSQSNQNQPHATPIPPTQTPPTQPTANPLNQNPASIQPSQATTPTTPSNQPTPAPQTQQPQSNQNQSYTTPTPPNGTV